MQDASTVGVPLQAARACAQCIHTWKCCLGSLIMCSCKKVSMKFSRVYTGVSEQYALQCIKLRYMKSMCRSFAGRHVRADTHRSRIVDEAFRAVS